ncbi:uncharacterized protein LOC122312550 [Carya illinoinensis]|uniref:uncharacterized protein LOC122312550 n=1 Tax=Carya illinoinensis TaxID=32201 RepID=UPI001C7262B3|nr:uncharacterized protein LOC122312550 [Carya illinoinensis]
MEEGRGFESSRFFQNRNTEREGKGNTKIEEGRGFGVFEVLPKSKHREERKEKHRNGGRKGLRLRWSSKVEIQRGKEGETHGLHVFRIREKEEEKVEYFVRLNLIKIISNKWYLEPRSMGTMRFDIEKFTGDNDFGLWRIKMRALLVQHGLQDALLGERKKGSSLKGEDRETVKEDILQKAHSALILSLGDKVLREVATEDTAAGIWLKLENLYMTKSLANRLHKKTKLYTFKMNPGTQIG